MIRFSGVVDANTDPKDTYLADGQLGIVGTNTPFGYPVASPFTFVSFVAELLTTYDPSGAPSGPFIVPTGGGVTFQLFHNGSAVASFVIAYGAGEGGVKAATAPLPEAFAVGDTFDLLVVSAGFTIVRGFSVSATIGID